jgi:hypothetical protein
MGPLLQVSSKLAEKVGFGTNELRRKKYALVQTSCFFLIKQLPLKVLSNAKLTGV